MTLKILEEDNRFRVEWQGYSVEWVDQTEEKLPKLLPSVGSVCIPRTTNCH